MTKKRETQQLKVFDQVKNCFRSLDLPVELEGTDGEYQLFTSAIKGLEDSVRFRVHYHPDQNMIVLETSSYHGIPEERRSEVLELIFLINKFLEDIIFEVSNRWRTITLCKFILDIEDAIDIDQFEIHIKTLIRDAQTYYPLIFRQVFSNLKPDEFLAEFLKDY